MIGLPLIPRYEPEVLDAMHRRRGIGEMEKVPTTSLRYLVVGGVTLLSRYRKADELRTMAMMVLALSRPQRRRLLTLFCDSKSGSYCADVRDCSLSDMQDVAAELGRAAVEAEGWHGGINIRAAGGVSYSLGGEYSGPEGVE